MKSPLIRLSIMLLNCLVVIYALSLLFIHRWNQLLNPLPILLLILGIACAFINLTYVFFNLIPVWNSFRIKLSPSRENQKDMTTQATAPQQEAMNAETMAIDDNLETVGIDENPKPSE